MERKRGLSQSNDGIQSKRHQPGPLERMVKEQEESERASSEQDSADKLTASKFKRISGDVDLSNARVVCLCELHTDPRHFAVIFRLINSIKKPIIGTLLTWDFSAYQIHQATFSRSNKSQLSAEELKDDLSVVNKLPLYY
jgi:hypothetical protein